MPDNFYVQDSCLACKSFDLVNYMNLDDQPLANTYHTEPDKIQEKFPLRLNFCISCSHSQLSHVVHPQLLFENYLYVSGTTKTLDKHFSDYVRDVLSDISTRVPRPSVLEIGSNDGSLLTKFLEQGCTVLGVDPAENLATVAEGKGVRTVVDYWSMSTVNDLQEHFDVIIGNNVFAHNLDPVGFLGACVAALQENGRIYLEMPMFPNTVNSLDIGQIYHEHVNFFTTKSFKSLLDTQIPCLKIVDFKSFPAIHGGTGRFVLALADNHSPDVDKLIEREEKRGFHSLSTYRKFNEDVLANLMNLFKACNAQDMLGYKVVGYGAAAKASTILGVLKGGVKPEYIIDDNPLKVGRFMPNTSIPIQSFHSLTGEDRLAIIIFPGNFKSEIKERLQGTLGKNNVVINITPFVSVEDLYD